MKKSISLLAVLFFLPLQLSAQQVWDVDRCIAVASVAAELERELPGSAQPAPLNGLLPKAILLSDLLASIENIFGKIPTERVENITEMQNGILAARRTDIQRGDASPKFLLEVLNSRLLQCQNEYL